MFYLTFALLNCEVGLRDPDGFVLLLFYFLGLLRYVDDIYATDV